MNNSGSFWKHVQKVAKSQCQPTVVFATVIEKSPLKIKYNGIERGSEFGDTIYVNQLLLDENIELDLSSLDDAQNFTSSTAYNSPSFNAVVSGSQKQFLIDFYNFFKTRQAKYILSIGDIVAVQKLGNNTYIILEKVQQYRKEN